MTTELPLLSDRWQLVSRIGEGAMGEVWHGRHSILGHDIAVKIMKPECANNKELVARFKREARIAAQLRHRNVVRVEDFGETPEGRPFLVMEFLRGNSLAELLEATPRPDRYTVASIVQQIAAACDLAHASGIVHRDLKPENCFLVRDDEQLTVKVLDFGVAKVTDGLFVTSAGLVTSSHSLLGTPMYMSPEQARGEKDLDGRSDLWSIGVITYEMLTGRMPWDAPALAQLLFAILTASPPPPTTVEPSLPTAVDAWIARALHRDRSNRFQTGRELAEALFSALGYALPPSSRSLVPNAPGGGSSLLVPLSLPPSAPGTPPTGTVVPKEFEGPTLFHSASGTEDPPTQRMMAPAIAAPAPVAVQNAFSPTVPISAAPIAQAPVAPVHVSAIPPTAQALPAQPYPAYGASLPPAVVPAYATGGALPVVPLQPDRSFRGMAVLALVGAFAGALGATVVFRTALRRNPHGTHTQVSAPPNVSRAATPPPLPMQPVNMLPIPTQPMVLPAPNTLTAPGTNDVVVPSPPPTPAPAQVRTTPNNPQPRVVARARPPVNQAATSPQVPETPTVQTHNNNANSNPNQPFVPEQP